MTPQEKAVIDAARAYRLAATADMSPQAVNLRIAVAVLEESVAEASPDRPLTYGQIVTTDEIYSEALGKWFEVLETNTDGAMVTFRLRGVGKLFRKPAGESVKVRRSEMGRAVDEFQILWSGVSKK